MSLRELNAATRRRLRWHGWLLTLWCLGVGFVASWMLLRALHVNAPAWRYAMSAVLMYALGLVLGTWVWLRYFAASVREQAQPRRSADADILGHATSIDKMAYDAEQGRPSLMKRGFKRIGEGFDWGDVLGGIADVFSFDEASWLLLVPALMVLALGALMLVGAMPVLLADGVAAMLAEIAVQFVFGALIARRVLRPRGEDEAFMHIVGKTWLAGLLLVALSALAGTALSQMAPGAASIGDLLRMH